MRQLNGAVIRLRSQAREVRAQRSGGATPGARDGVRADGNDARTGNVTIQLTEPPFVLPSHIQSLISHSNHPPITSESPPQLDLVAWETRAQTVENRIQRLSQAARALRDRAQAQGERRQRMMDRPLRSDGDRLAQRSDTSTPWRQQPGPADARLQRLLGSSEQDWRRDQERIVDGIRDMEGLNSSIGGELEGVAGQIHGLLLGRSAPFDAADHHAAQRCQRRASKSHTRRHEVHISRPSRSRGCAPTNTQQVARQPAPQVIGTPHASSALQPTPEPASGHGSTSVPSNTSSPLGLSAPAQPRPSYRNSNFNLPPLREALGLDERSVWAFGADPELEDDEGTVRGTPPPGGRARVGELEDSIARIENRLETSGGTYRSLVNGAPPLGGRSVGASTEDYGAQSYPQAPGTAGDPHIGAGSGTLREAVARLRGSANRPLPTPALDAALEALRARSTPLQSSPVTNPPNETMEMAVELGPVVIIGGSDGEEDWSDDSLDDIFEEFDPTAPFGGIGDVLAAGGEDDGGSRGGRRQEERSTEQNSMTFRGRRVANRIAASSSSAPSPDSPPTDPTARRFPRWDHPAAGLSASQLLQPNSTRFEDGPSPATRPNAGQALGPNFLGGPVGRWRLAPLEHTREAGAATDSSQAPPSNGASTPDPATSARNTSAPNSARHQEMMARIRHAREALRNIRGLREDMGTLRRGPPGSRNMPEVAHRGASTEMQAREEAVVPPAGRDGVQPVRGETASGIQPGSQAVGEGSSAQEGSSDVQSGPSRSSYAVCDKEDSDFGIQQWPMVGRV
ncbi:hypothetical protein IAR50_006384 [Cryptococcus sp. DSM 104548]